jgi:ABC-type Mn2+/Zn2+ transport system ATPase subunit
MMTFEASNVTLSIDNIKILNNVSFNIPTYQFTSIMGPNGSGKSSILKILIGELLPINGTVTSIPNNLIAYIPQTLSDPPFLLVSEIINLGMRLRKISKKNKLAIAHGISKECGIELLLDRKFESLSGGEKQRVWLSFCLAQDKEIILLDEPLSSIDHHSREDFHKTLQKISRKSKTLLLVTHDNDLSVKYSDKIIYMRNGSIEFDGSSSDFKKYHTKE